MLYDNGMEFFPRRFNETCLVNNLDGKFRCQKLDNIGVINDNKNINLCP